MDLAGKLEVDVELKASGDEFYKIFSNQVHQMPTASSRIQAVDLHEGDWETPGSIKLWKYTIDGKTEVFKERIHFDDKDKCIIMDGVGGHALEKFKKYKGIFQVINKDEGGLVKLTLEYEKHKEADEPPSQYLDFVAALIRDIDEHLVKAA
ncbi:hypothetical protein Ddye_030266 [Dipteronia dyeriana]|uniref:Bet v I/Major latex protein domain-containing protein n=1 Tax=Dipteronia dyeriana TaxID=168575 RepID=A0AAD9WLB9_9ROSI|nr:hypothetical protein Ddye_030266 [Dipteronia dyeriana]